MSQIVMNLTLYCLAWILHKTYRYRFYQYEHRVSAQVAHPTGTFILALWHGNSFIGTLSHTHQRFAPLCSRSPDGQMVAFLCRRMGLRPILGSSSKGGKEARSEMEIAIGDGVSPAITVDGPKGPRGIAKGGVVDVARKTGAHILPMIAAGDRNWKLGSWDKLKIPKPFARVAICYGRPISVSEGVSGEAFEQHRQQVDEALNSLEDEAGRCLAEWSSRSTFRTYAKLTSKPG